MSKWENRRTELVTAVARHMGPYGTSWGDVAREMNERYDEDISAKACESAFWRLSNETDGQASVDARLLKRKMSTNDTYAKIAEDFPGYTIQELKNRMKILSGRGGDNKWVDGLRVGFLDIEATGFDSNIDIMLSWAIKERDEDIEYDVITREEAIDWDKQDRRITESLVEAIKGYDMLVTWFGTRFDIKAVRTRMEWWETEQPLKYGDRVHYDLYYTARNKLNMHSNRLEAVANFFGIEMQYKDFDPYLWRKARLGYKEELEYILEHNIEDVEVTELVFNKLKKFKKMTRKSV